MISTFKFWSAWGTCLTELAIEELQLTEFTMILCGTLVSSAVFTLNVIVWGTLTNYIECIERISPQDVLLGVSQVYIWKQNSQHNDYIEITRAIFFWKLLPHWLHWKGFKVKPVCNFWWTTRLLLDAKYLLHWVHWKDFSPGWITEFGITFV